MHFIGADLTDPYARTERLVTIAVVDGAMGVMFDTWKYNRHGERLVSFDRAVLAIDGPQGLAKRGATMRECERTLGAAGKTPDHLPEAGPFAGFVRGSVELFHELNQRMHLVANVDDGLADLLEVYPGAAWKKLAPTALPNKKTKVGRDRRKEMLETVGLRLLPGSPTHDQLDAALAAYIAMRFRAGKASFAGIPPFIEGGVLREGFIVRP